MSDNKNFVYIHTYIYKLVPVVENDPKASFSIGRYSFP